MLPNENKWSILAYIPFFGLPFCLIAGVKFVNKELVLFHIRHGLVLFGVTIGVLVIGIFSSTLSLMAWGINLLVHGVGAMNAFAGKMGKIPVVTDFALKIDKYYVFRKLTGKEPGAEELGNSVENPENDDNLTKQNK